MTFLSIVVPVYNVEAYLERCIESVITQNVCGIELLLIDDGSKDRSPLICDKYASCFEFIKVIHQENQGLSGARNTGIINSKGKYILFLDSDDYLEPDCIEKIIKELEKRSCDVFIGTAYKVYPSGEKSQFAIHHKISEGCYSSEEYLKRLKIKKDYSACAWLNICSREFLMNNNLWFKQGIIHEDELWTPQVLLTAKSIQYRNLHFYNYFIREGSIMNSFNYEKSCMCIAYVCKELLKIYDNHADKEIEALRNQVTEIYLQAIIKAEKISMDYRVIDKYELVKNSYFLKTKIKAILYWISPRIYKYVHKHMKKN